MTFKKTLYIAIWVGLLAIALGFFWLAWIAPQP